MGTASPEVPLYSTQPVGPAVPGPLPSVPAGPQAGPQYTPPVNEITSQMTPEQSWNMWLAHQNEWQDVQANNPEEYAQRMENASSYENLQNVTDYIDQWNEAKNFGGNKSDSGFVRDWYNAIHAGFAHNPQAFSRWAAENPEYAVRWHALAARDGSDTNTANWNREWGKKGHQDEAYRLAYGISQDLGWGEDGKNNGQGIAADYKTFEDISSEWGGGDFWKIGTPQKFTDGLGNFIEENPGMALAAAASLAIPAAAPALAGAIGVSPAVASGIMNAGLSLASGGDLQDVVTAGLSAYGLEHLAGTDFEWLGQFLPKGDSQVGSALEEALGYVPGVAGAGLLLNQQGAFNRGGPDNYYGQQGQGGSDGRRVTGYDATGGGSGNWLAGAQPRGGNPYDFGPVEAGPMTKLETGYDWLDDYFGGTSAKGLI